MAPRKVLNVGGNNKKIPIPAYFAEFEHLLLDIDPRGNPDVLCDARKLSELEPNQFDAIYCSHNLEHYYAHETAQVLKGFIHVLKEDGFAEIRVPDLDMLIKTYAQKSMDLEDILYTSPAGPITVRDVFYGFGREIEQSGLDFYAHKTGFTKKTLTRALSGAGFKCAVQRPGRAYELALIAFVNQPARFHEELFKFNLAGAPPPAQS